MTRHSILVTSALGLPLLAFMVFVALLGLNPVSMSTPAKPITAAESGSSELAKEQIHQGPDRPEAARAFVEHQLAHTSLADTAVPDVLQINENGRLVVDAGSKAIMDYFLSLSGEIPDQEIRELLARWTRQTAGEPAAQDMLALFDQYQAYRVRLATGEFAAGDDRDIRRQMHMRQDVREQIFGAEQAAALFARQDLHDQFSLARRDILTADLPSQDEERALAQLHQSLPPHLAKQYEQQHHLQQLEQREQAILASGGTEADVYSQRQRHFGAAAADRLRALDETRQAWDARLTRYREQRERILASAQAADDQQQQIRQLRESLFTDTERLRVAALDRMADGAR